MTLIDTHCHLYLEQFEEDLEEVLQHAADANVKHIMLPAIDWSSIKDMEKLTHSDITFHKMAGIHPCNVSENWPVNEQKLYDYCSRKDFIAVGETGLDYYWNKDDINMQKESLKTHCDVAKAVKKPVVLHNRESTNDLLDLIEEQQDGSLTGVWHCFTGNREEGERALDLGLYLGIGGVFTFRNAGVDKVVEKLPLDKMILETDAPYLAPVPHRGKRNEPAYVTYTAVKLAMLKGVSMEVLADITTKTAKSLFRI
ncbi:MAG: TatD family hydrolase [Balneolaceae bacterium]